MTRSAKRNASATIVKVGLKAPCGEIPSCRLHIAFRGRHARGNSHRLHPSSGLGAIESSPYDAGPHACRLAIRCRLQEQSTGVGQTHHSPSSAPNSRPPMAAIPRLSSADSRQSTATFRKPNTSRFLPSPMRLSGSGICSGRAIQRNGCHRRWGLIPGHKPSAGDIWLDDRGIFLVTEPRFRNVSAPFAASTDELHQRIDLGIPGGWKRKRIFGKAELTLGFVGQPYVAEQSLDCRSPFVSCTVFASLERLIRVRLCKNDGSARVAPNGA